MFGNCCPSSRLIICRGSPPHLLLPAPAAGTTSWFSSSRTEARWPSMAIRLAVLTRVTGRLTVEDGPVGAVTVVPRRIGIEGVIQVGQEDDVVDVRLQSRAGHRQGGQRTGVRLPGGLDVALGQHHHDEL